jgi:hypothetical protein
MTAEQLQPKTPKESWISFNPEICFQTGSNPLLKHFQKWWNVNPCVLSNLKNTIIILITFYAMCFSLLAPEFTFNSNKSPTWCNSYSVYYHGVCLQLNTFRAFSRPSSRPQRLQWQPLVIPSYCGYSRAVFVVGLAGRPTRPRTQHNYHHHTKVNPEAATAAIELLMMGGKTPETCWAVNKRQDNKLKNCCISLVIYLNCTMMHGLTNLKFYI